MTGGISTRGQNRQGGRVVFSQIPKRVSIVRFLCQSYDNIALLHEWLGIFELPHKPNHQLPPRGPLARGGVIGGLARVVIQKFTTTSVVMRLPID